LFHNRLLPELLIWLSREKKMLIVQYKWNTPVTGFRMPVKISRSRNNFDFIYPTTSSQTIRLKDLKKNEFEVAKNEFYIKVTKETK
jgi:hypothetical protein